MYDQILNSKGKEILEDKLQYIICDYFNNINDNSYYYYDKFELYKNEIKMYYNDYENIETLKLDNFLTEIIDFYYDYPETILNDKKYREYLSYLNLSIHLINKNNVIFYDSESAIID